MKAKHLFWRAFLLCALFSIPAVTCAQGTGADYTRALLLRNKFQALAIDIPERANWIDQTSRFWYRKSVKGGNEFVLVDAETLARKPAFDHERLAVSLSAATNEKLTALTLPFSVITFVDAERGIQFVAAGSIWKCDLSDYRCSKTGPAPQGQPGRPPSEDGPSEYGNDVYDGTTDLSPQQGQQQRRPASQEAGAPLESQNPKASPDGTREAFIQNYNVFVRPKGKTDAVALSYDGSEGNYYTLVSIAWSPDSKHLVAYRVRPGYRREVHYVESSPADQLQPKHSTRDYAKPGDALDVAQPIIFEVETKRQIVVDNSLFQIPIAYPIQSGGRTAGLSLLNTISAGIRSIV